MDVRLKILLVVTAALGAGLVALTVGPQSSAFDERTRILVSGVTRNQGDLGRQVDELAAIADGVEAGRIGAFDHEGVYRFHRAQEAVSNAYGYFWACYEARQCSWRVLQEQCPLALEARDALDYAYPDMIGTERPAPEAIDNFIDRCSADG